MNVTLQEFDRLVFALTEDNKQSRTFEFCGTTVTIDDANNTLVKFVNDYGAQCEIHGDGLGYRTFYANGAMVASEKAMLDAKPSIESLAISLQHNELTVKQFLDLIKDRIV